jgi:alpha-galactosidase/6-phospho-beta-glucosidase family protein
MAGVVGEAGGVRTAGLCVEVDGLRGALAYYFRVPYESIELTYAGVNHDGWVLDLKVNGQDGYALWQTRWGEVERDPDYHPGNRGLRPIFGLTRHMRSSGYHTWPYAVAETPEDQTRWEAWRGKREMYIAALEDALRVGEPITDPPGIHPERSKVNYPYTGLTVGKLMQSIATDQANVIPLQVPNHGAISNFPDRAIVEVPTLVQGRAVQAMPVGEMPEWLGGYTRLLAVQRRLIVEYVLNRNLTTLKQALATLPMFGTVQQLNELAEALHREFSQ